jgi:hypothetical protein
VREVANDESWRMRYMLAERLPELTEYLDPKMLTEIFIQFLQDSESEVVIAIIGKLGKFCKYLDAESIIKKVIPHLKKISNDPLVHARSTHLP